MLNFFCLVIVKYFELVTCNLYLAFLWQEPLATQQSDLAAASQGTSAAPPGTSAASQKKVSMAKAKAKASQEANAKPETQKAVSKRMKKEEHAAVEAVPPQEAEADADTVRFCEDLVSMCEDFGDKPCKEGSLPRQNAQDFPSDPDSADVGLCSAMPCGSENESDASSQTVKDLADLASKHCPSEPESFRGSFLWHFLQHAWPKLSKQLSDELDALWATWKVNSQFSLNLVASIFSVDLKQFWLALGLCDFNVNDSIQQQMSQPSDRSMWEST